MISNFSELFTELKEKGICRKLVVAWGVDEHSIEASYRAVEMGFVQAILVGDRARIEKVCAEKGFENWQIHHRGRACRTQGCKYGRSYGSR